MPVLAISAVDHTTGILTCVAHSRATGDGPGALYTPNGALPTGWAPVTDYWLIRVDADHLKLADSSAHAMAGTAIALPSDNGSGTLQLLVGLPYRRATTYVAGSQVKSADLDAMQDDQVALWNLLTGQAQAIYSGITLPPNFNVKLSGTGHVLHDDQGEVLPFTGPDDWYVSTGAPASMGSGGVPDRVTVPSSSTLFYPLKIGNVLHRLKSITVFGRSLVDTTTLKLYATSGIGGATLLTSVLTLSGGGTSLAVPADGLFNPRVLTLQTPWSDHAIGCPIWLEVSTTATGTFAAITYKPGYDVPV